MQSLTEVPTQLNVAGGLIWPRLANDRSAVCLDNTVAKRESSCVVCIATVKLADNFGGLVRLEIQEGQQCIEVLQRYCSIHVHCNLSVECVESQNKVMKCT